VAVNQVTSNDELTKSVHVNEFTSVVNSSDAANTDYSGTQEYFNETEAADDISEGNLSLTTPPAPTGLRNSDGSPMLLDASDYGY